MHTQMATFCPEDLPQPCVCIILYSEHRLYTHGKMATSYITAYSVTVHVHVTVHVFTISAMY